MNNLKRKIVSIIMICTIIAIIVTGTISVNTANKIISENAVQRMNLLCDYNRLSFNDMLSGIEQSVNILAKYTVLSLIHISMEVYPSDFMYSTTSSPLSFVPASIRSVFPSGSSINSESPWPTSM